MVAVYVSVCYQVVFEVAFNSARGGYVAIDDISFSPEFCHTDTGWKSNVDLSLRLTTGTDCSVSQSWLCEICWTQSLKLRLLPLEADI